MKMLIFSFLVVTGFVSAFSQEKIIDKSEFEGVYKQSAHPYFRWKGKDFREIITTESRMLGRTATDYSSKNATEFGRDGSIRSVRNSTFGEKVGETFESIKIGDVNYSRKGNGEWTKNSVSSPPVPPVSPPRPTPYEVIATETEYKYLGTELYKNRRVRTYSKTEKQTAVVKADGSTRENVAVTKYWFDDDGTMLKSEFRSNSKNAEKAIFTGVVMEWELDPSISIVAPTGVK